MSIQNLREKRAKAIEQARAVLNAVEAEGRTMNDEETRKWDGWMTEADNFKATIERMERLEAEERALDASLGRRTHQPSTRTSTNDGIRSWLLSENAKDLSFSLRSTAPRTTDTANWEQRALSFAAGAGAEVVPEGFVNQLEVALLTFGGVRSVASVLRTESGNDLPWPMTNDTDNEGEILGVNATVNEQDIAFEMATLKAYKYSSKLIRVPVELLQDSAVDLSAEIGARLGERIGRITNKHFTTGTGVNQPQGIVTGATVGLTGTDTDAITYEEIIDLIHSVDPAYRNGARFMFADSTLKELRKLRDNDGKLIWQPGLVAGHPDTIAGYQFVVNQAMPAMAANAKSIVYGDLSKYKVRDVLNVTLVRLNERFADAHQVGFLAFSSHDGRLLDAGTHPVKVFQNAAA